MSTQVGIGKSIHRNPKIAATQAVELALKTGAIEKADFVFMFSSAGYDQKTIVKYVYDLCGGAPGKDQATNDKKETEPRGHSSAGRKRAMIRNNRNAKSGQRELNKGY